MISQEKGITLKLKAKGHSNRVFYYVGFHMHKLGISLKTTIKEVVILKAGIDRGKCRQVNDLITCGKYREIHLTPH